MFGTNFQILTLIFVSEPVHCIVWAKHLFNQLFGEADPDEDVSPDTEDPEASGEDAGKKVQFYFLWKTSKFSFLWKTSIVLFPLEDVKIWLDFVSFGRHQNILQLSGCW